MRERADVVIARNLINKLIASTYQEDPLIALGQPGRYILQDVSNACSCSTGVEDSKARERAELIARDLIEYINSIDYQKYFDAMGRPGARGGDKEKQFSDFSIRAVDAAQVTCSNPYSSA